MIWSKAFGSKNKNFMFDVIVSASTLIACGSQNDSPGGDNFYTWQEGTRWIVKYDIFRK
ncbi:MAG: hypothetical protein LBD20_05240 [Spirochaetaceae bacterium]|jgi:hypothetical protein|nr:hypothetical protein [Spirochaetaceae bacterium]